MSNSSKRYSRRQPKQRLIVRPDPLSETEKLAIQAVRGVAAIRRLINVEEKFFDVSTSISPGNTTAHINILTAMPLGDDANTRDGRSVLGQRLQVRLTCAIAPTETLATFLRCIIFSDKVTNGVTPATADVLQQISGSGTFLNAPYNHDTYLNRFIIHHDSNILVTNPASATPKQELKVNLSYNRHVKFLASGSGVASAESGHLYILLVSDSTSTPTLNPSANYTTRFTFTDN